MLKWLICDARVTEIPEPYEKTKTKSKIKQKASEIACEEAKAWYKFP